MIPVDQDIFIGDKQGRIGNCLQAAIASIIEFPMSEVPHFASLPGDEWFLEMLAWTTGKGYDVCDCEINEYPEYYVLAFGKSPREVSHAVVYKNGQLVHDPHPSRAGLLNITWSAVLIKQ